MTAIFLASQCEFSRFTDKPVEENGYQDVKCYNTDNLLPLQQVALSLCICLSQGLETTWLFLQVGVNRRGSLRGAGMDVVGRKEVATTPRWITDCTPRGQREDAGFGPALFRSFFPEEAQVGETVHSLSKDPVPRGEHPSKAEAFILRLTARLPRLPAPSGRLAPWTGSRAPSPLPPGRGGRSELGNFLAAAWLEI